MSEPLTPRQKAGRENRQKWKGITPEGIERLRKAAYKNRPWERSTGPRSPQGKSISRANALKHGGRAFAVLPDHVRDFVLALRDAERALGPLPEDPQALTDMVLDDPGELLLATRACRLAIRYYRLRLKGGSQRVDG